jgi:hypothetical protein
MIRLHALSSIAGLLVAPLLGVQPDPCPPGRTLEQQIAAADVVVLGKVTYDRDCLPLKGGLRDGRFDRLLRDSATASVAGQTWS